MAQRSASGACGDLFRDLGVTRPPLASWACPRGFTKSVLGSSTVSHAMLPLAAVATDWISFGAILAAAVTVVTTLIPRLLKLPQKASLDRIEYHIERMKRMRELDALERERMEPALRLRPERGPAMLDVADIHERLAWLDLGGDDGDIELPRYFPVSVYVDSGNLREFTELRDALDRFLRASGFEVVSEQDVQRGSIFQRFTAKLKEPATKSELRRQLELAQLTLQQQTLGRVQSEINAHGAQAALNLSQTLAMHDDCVISFGAMVGVTRTDPSGRRQTVIVELTPEELIKAQRGGRGLGSSAEAFAMLSRLRPEEVEAQTRPGLHELPPPDRRPAPRELPPGDEFDTGT
jgi:hypothetical protein